MKAFIFLLCYHCSFAGLFLASTGSVSAQVIVNNPAAITRRVLIQPIRVNNTSGEAATTFGTPESEAYIKAQINRVWAQIGVRIDWLPFTEFTNDFAYDGSPGKYISAARPTAHLNTIIDKAPTPPKNKSAIVINMFFVEIIPGSNQPSDNETNGLAWVDANGIIIYVGSNLLDWDQGLDAIASVMAHEIGHNLGLDHEANGGDNLMSPYGTSGKLTSAQKSRVFNDNRNVVDGFDFLQSLPPVSNYLQWAGTKNVTGAPGDDDDLDGISNFLEFMLNLDPNVFSSMPLMVSSDDGLVWTLPKNPLAVADGIVYEVETSETLTSWEPAGADNGRSVVVKDDAALLVVLLKYGGNQRFMRLNVDIPSALGAVASSLLPPHLELPQAMIADPVDERTVFPPDN